MPLVLPKQPEKIALTAEAERVNKMRVYPKKSKNNFMFTKKLYKYNYFFFLSSSSH
jgi:hypothetical protein